MKQLYSTFLFYWILAKRSGEISHLQHNGEKTAIRIIPIAIITTL